MSGDKKAKAQKKNFFSEKRNEGLKEQALKDSPPDSAEAKPKPEDSAHKAPPQKLFKAGRLSQSLKDKIKDNKKAPAQKKPSLEEKLKTAVEENLYLRAEFENFKKRSLEERSKLARYAGEEFISALAGEVLDDLERALESAQREKSLESLQKGLELTQKKLSRLFEKFGVQVLDPTGEAFDPSYQEALSHIKTSKIPEGSVAETYKKAYKLHDKVIRPAQVILAKKED